MYPIDNKEEIFHENITFFFTFEALYWYNHFSENDRRVP